MWNELNGGIHYAAGAAGTVTVPVGARVTQIRAVDTGGGGTVVIFGGDAIPLTAAVPLALQFNHALMVSKTGAGLNTIVFTGTDQHYVEYVTTDGS